MRFMSRIGQDVISEKPKRQIPSWVLEKIEQKPFRLEYFPPTIHVYSPYNFDFIRELKEKIPAEDRKWNPQEKRWEISDKYENLIKELGEKYYGLSENEFLEKVYNEGRLVRITKAYKVYEIDRTPQLDVFARSYGQSSDRFYITPGSILSSAPLVTYIANPGYYYEKAPSVFEIAYTAKKLKSHHTFLPECFKNLQHTALFDFFRRVKEKDILELPDEKIAELIKEVNSANRLFKQKINIEELYDEPGDNLRKFIAQLDVREPKAVGRALKAYFKIVE